MGPPSMAQRAFCASMMMGTGRQLKGYRPRAFILPPVEPARTDHAAEPRAGTSEGFMRLDTQIQLQFVRWLRTRSPDFGPADCFRSPASRAWLTYHKSKPGRGFKFVFFAFFIFDGCGEGLLC